MVPCSVLPAARRTSGISMPWSMELRTRCTSGSPIFSSTVLSSSVVSPVTLQLDLLAEALAEVAHQAREAVEHEADGQHAHAHDAFLQRAHVALELAERVAQLLGLAAFERRGELAQHRLRDHQLADGVQQLVDLLDADADRAAVAGRRRCACAASAAGAAGRWRGWTGGRRRRIGSRRGSDAGVAARRRRAAPPMRSMVSSHSLSDPLEHRVHGGFARPRPEPRGSSAGGILPGRARPAAERHSASTRHFAGCRASPARAGCAADRCRGAVVWGRERNGCASRESAPVRRRRAACRAKAAAAAALAGAAAVPASLMMRSISARSWRRARCRSASLRCVATSMSRMASPERSSTSTRSGSHLALAGAQLVEQRLEHVREAGHFVEAESRAAALDGMRDAENGVDQLGVDFTGRELQQRRLHRVERLETLVEEGVVELREVERHAGYSEQRADAEHAMASSSAGERACPLVAMLRSRQSSANATTSCTPAVSTCSTLPPSIS